MGRSLRASEEGVQKVKNALKRLGWKQQSLATRVGCSRQTISSFLKRKPISCEIFESICSELGFTIEEVAEIESKDINNLVLKVREIIESIIRDRCGTMRIFDMTQPIGLNDIYTHVNMLEKITAHRRKSINELLQECESGKLEGWVFGKTTEKRFPGIEAVEKYRKLMIWGNPGAGKTTFLKYIAIQCIEGNFLSDYLPIFLTLRDFAEAADKQGILEYIHQEFLPNLPRQESSLQEIIREGRAIILFDGLDEVREVNVEDVIRKIRDFSDRYPANHFIITCRIAAREYTFDKFTEVEVANFDEEQISKFANNWFKNKSVKPEYFLVPVPENERVLELATNPLLLTLLCLAFEESGDFPANRSELYKEGLDALLKKWDAKRGIQRHQVYGKLSPQRKEDLLSKIAWITFENGELFFKQKVAEKYITDYICNLPGANTDEEALQLDSEVVLRSIESQHGLLVERAKSVYSFSHLTFHEYLTAREIVIGKNSSEKALKGLVSHLTDYRWQEVFLLAVGMSSNADGLLLLMKEKVDGIFSGDEKLQNFLRWVNEKSLLCDISVEPLIFSLLYFIFECIFNILFFVHEEVSKFTEESDINNFKYFYQEFLSGFNKASIFFNDLMVEEELKKSDLMVDIELYKLLKSTLLPNIYYYLATKDIIDNIIKYRIDLEFKEELHQLKSELPNSNQPKEKFEEWLKINGQPWSNKLRKLIIKYRNICHDWQFNDEQLFTLRDYYYANGLLLNCLNSDCYVSREVRQEIEDTLLLPTSEIQKRNTASL